MFSFLGDKLWNLRQMSILNKWYSSCGMIMKFECYKHWVGFFFDNLPWRVNTIRKKLQEIQTGETDFMDIEESDTNDSERHDSDSNGSNSNGSDSNDSDSTDTDVSMVQLPFGYEHTNPHHSVYGNSLFSLFKILQKKIRS